MPFKKSRAAIKRSGNGRTFSAWDICSKSADRKYYTFAHKRSGFFTLGGPGAVAGNQNLNWNYSTAAGFPGKNLLDAGWTQQDITVNPMLIGDSGTGAYPFTIPPSNLSQCLSNVSNSTAAVSDIVNMYSPEILEYQRLTPVAFETVFVIKKIKSMVNDQTTSTARWSDLVTYYDSDPNVGGALPPGGIPQSEITLQNYNNMSDVPMEVYYYKDFKNLQAVQPFHSSCTDPGNARQMIRMFSEGIVKKLNKRKGKKLAFKMAVKMPLHCWKNQISIADTTFYNTNLFNNRQPYLTINGWNQSGLFNEYRGATKSNCPGFGTYLWFKLPALDTLDYLRVGQAITTGIMQMRYFVEYDIITKWSFVGSVRDGLLSQIGTIYPGTLSFKRRRPPLNDDHERETADDDVDEVNLLGWSKTDEPNALE